MGLQKPEQAAWALLMASFLAACGLAMIFWQPLYGYVHQHDLRALLSTGRSQMLAGDAAGADATLARLVSRYPEREEALLAYAEFLDRQERHAEAAEYYARAAAAGRQRFSAVRRYAGFLERQGKAADALALYQDYLRRHPGDSAAQYDLGVRYLHRKRYEEALTHLGEAARNEALRYDALRYMGRAHAALAHWEQARTVWERLTALGPGPAHALFLQDIAASYEAEGQWEAAADVWQRYLDVFPSALAGARRLRAGYERLGQTGGAALAARLVEALSPPIRAESTPQDGVRVIGMGPLANGAAGVGGDVYIEALRTIEQQERLAWRFEAVKDGQVLSLEAAPAHAATAPLWRGETARQRVVLGTPEAMTGGGWRIQVRLGRGSEEPAPLWQTTGEGNTP